MYGVFSVLLCDVSVFNLTTNPFVTADKKVHFIIFKMKIEWDTFYQMKTKSIFDNIQKWILWKSMLFPNW